MRAMTDSSKIDFVLNGERESVPIGFTVADLLDRLNIRTKAIAVEVNQQIVPGDQFKETKIQADDVLEIVTLVGGG